MRLLLVFVTSLLTNQALYAGTTAQRCEELFALHLTKAAAAVANVVSTNAGAPKRAAVTPSAPVHSGLVNTEVISSIVSGAQIYSMVLDANSQQAQGLYTRTQSGWTPVIHGRPLIDDRGTPLLAQLGLSRTDDKGYILTVMNGRLYLLTRYSDLQQANTYYEFGSKEHPLYEVGSSQKRFINNIEQYKSISIYQNPLLTEKGSQLILVSLKYEQMQAFGEGITFAFEVIPQKEKSQVGFNGRPLVIDYEFRDSSQLAKLIGGSKQQLVFSKILVENLENQDFSTFGDHLNFVLSSVKTVVTTLIETASTSGHTDSKVSVSYNMTTQKIEKNVTFSQVYNLNTDRASDLPTVEQHYNPANGQSHLFVKISNRYNGIEIPGMVDLNKEGKPYLLGFYPNNEGGGLISVEGKLILITKRSDNYTFLELGPTENFIRNYKSYFPTEVSYSFYLPETATDGVSEGFIILSLKSPQDVKGITAALGLRMYNGKDLVRGHTIKTLTNFYIRTSELAKRIAIALPSNLLLFDNLTEQTSSDPVYDQVYDASKPHLNLSKYLFTGNEPYQFKSPREVSEISNGLRYASFTYVNNVKNPSGVYFNLGTTAITGNEEAKFCVTGELLQNPKKVASQEQTKPSQKKEKEDLFSYAKLLVREKNEEGLTRESAPMKYELNLLALDSSHKQGSNGFSTHLFVYNHAKNMIKSFTINLPRETMGPITNLLGAYFISGQSGHSESAYLIVSLLEKQTDRFGNVTKEGPSTYMLTLNSLEKLPEASELPLTKLGEFELSPNVLQNQIGFTPNGTPIFNLTPELAEDAYGFAVFDFETEKKFFTNQDVGGSKLKVKFGSKQALGDYADTSYVKESDSWRVYPEDIRKNYPQLGAKSSELAQFDSFQSLGLQLDAMADLKNPAQRLMLVVPESIREITWDYVLNKAMSGKQKRDYFSSYMDEKESEHKKTNSTFNYASIGLDLNLFNPAKSSQEQFFTNLTAWRKYQENKQNHKRRHFLLTRFDELVKNNNGFPEPKDTSQRFEIVDAVSGGESKSASLTEVASAKQVRTPHALYLLAAEAPLSLREFRKNKSDTSSTSMLVVITSEELKKLKESAALEIENGLFDRFKIQEIKNPDAESMASSIGSIFENPDVKSLDYTFSAKEIKPKSQLSVQENFDTVVEYAISRFSYLQNQKKDSLLESFMRFKSQFALAVLADKEARSSRVINKHFVERVLVQVFDIPMNLATLPADDPLRILARPDALLKLQEAGYSGPFDLKARVINTLLSQTRADAGKPVPSSIILFGATGSGKTFMFKSLVKMLGLTMYDFSKSMDQNRDASAIIINVGQLKNSSIGNNGQSNNSSNNSNNNGGEGNMDIDQALLHLNAFLGLPNGYRGHILIDDVHAATDQVKAKILAWERSLFESQNGMTRIVLPNGTNLRKPVRNMNIWMTLNPTADQDQIAKYSKDKNNPTTEEVLLATLSSPDFKIEPSFLRRWGSIINLDFMPAGAKGPELVKNVARASNELLNTHARIALIDPRVIGTLVANNAKVDARSFLSASTSSLIEKVANFQTNGSLIFVMPTSLIIPAHKSSFGEDDTPSADISRWVDKNTRTISLDTGVEGHLLFIKMIVDAFRIPQYEQFIVALQEDPRFAADLTVQKNILAPVLLAISDHIKQHETVAARDLHLNASEFNFRTPSERDVFRKLLKEIDNTPTTPLVPDYFQSIEAFGTTWQHLVAGSHSPETQTAMQYKKNAIAKIKKDLTKLLHKKISQILHVSDVDMLPNPTEWLKQITPQKSDSKLSTKEIVNTLWDFFPEILKNHELNENNSANSAELTIYGATRLFLYSMDSVITKLPWVANSQFLLSSLELITQDQVLSQKPGVQDFLFTDPQRLIKPTLPDFAYQIIDGSQAFHIIPATTHQKMKQEFDTYLKHLEQGN